MTFGELAELARDGGNGAEAVRTAYGWERDRLVAAMRGSLAFAAALLVALAAPFLNQEFDSPSWPVLVTAASSLVFFLFGMFILIVRLPRQLDEYVLAARLLAALRDVNDE
jgi:hypothetical protein